MGTGYPQSNSMNTLPTPATLETIQSGEKQVYKFEWGIAMGRTISEDTSSGCRNDEAGFVECSANKASSV